MNIPSDELEKIARKYCELMGWHRDEFMPMATAETQKFLALWEATRDYRQLKESIETDEAIVDVLKDVVKK